jgi:hypothetical protein
MLPTTYAMYTAAGTPDLAGSVFATAGLTVGRTSEESSERSRSPEVRTFSSVMAVDYWWVAIGVGLGWCSVEEKGLAFEVQQRLPRRVEVEERARVDLCSTAEETGRS